METSYAKKSRIRIPRPGTNPVGVVVVLRCPPDRIGRVTQQLSDMYCSFKKTRKNGSYGVARLSIKAVGLGLQLTFLPSQALDPYAVQSDSVFFFDSKSNSICLELQRLDVSLVSYSSHDLKVSRHVGACGV